MEDRKESFLLYQASYKAISLLSDEEAGVLFKALFQYNKSGEIPDLPREIMLVFVTMQDYLDENAEKWEGEKERRSRAGKIAAQARAEKSNRNESQRNATNRNESQPNPTVYVSDSVSDSVSVSVSESDAQHPTPPDTTPKKPTGQYGHILLTDAELDRLMQCRPKDWEAKLQRLDDYIEQTGKVYKNHLLTILRWAEEDDRKEAANRKKDQESVHFDLERKQTGDEDFFDDIFGGDI